MSTLQHANLQHERITTLAIELRLLAVPDLYGPIAQTVAARKDASYVDFLEHVLRSERDARHIRPRSLLKASNNSHDAGRPHKLHGISNRACRLCPSASVPVTTILAPCDSGADSLPTSLFGSTTARSS